MRFKKEGVRRTLCCDESSEQDAGCKKQRPMAYAVPQAEKSGTGDHENTTCLAEVAFCPNEV